jgi:hypothetical protein
MPKGCFSQAFPYEITRPDELDGVGLTYLALKIREGSSYLAEFTWEETG